MNVPRWNRRRYRGPLSDVEVVEQFACDATLLVIADLVYVTETQRLTHPAVGDRIAERSSSTVSGATRRDALRLRRRRLLLVPLAIAIIATASVFALWPAQSPTIIDTALAALGTEPVLHMVTATETDLQTVAIEGGDSRQLIERTEAVFDAASRTLRTTVTVDGTVVRASIETPQGGSTSFGPIHTCLWISRHPAEATKLGLSCPSGPTPATAFQGIDPALSGFLDSYRSALANGQARILGTGEVNGHAVAFLSVRTGRDRTDTRVAIDRTTGKPLQIVAAGNRRIDVLDIETKAYDAKDFSPPQRLKRALGGTIVEREVIDVDRAQTVISEPLILGEGVTDLHLASVEQRTARDTSGHEVKALVLSYSPATKSESTVEIIESAEPVGAFGWGALRGIPVPQGSFIQTVFGAFLQQRETYVVLRSTPSYELNTLRALDLARALVPLTEK